MKPDAELPKRFARIVVRELASIRAVIETMAMHDLLDNPKKMELFKQRRQRRAKKLLKRLSDELGLDCGDVSENGE